MHQVLSELTFVVAFSFPHLDGQPVLLGLALYLSLRLLFFMIPQAV
jgi:hypothetical protein